MMSISIDNTTISIIISAASFIVALISLIKSSKVTKLDEKIKELELEKLEAEKNAVKKPLVEARLIHVSKNNNKLKVWNSGEATAYNINVEIDDKEIIVLEPVTPFEKLEAGTSFEETVVLTFSSSRKFKIITSWLDENGNQDCKEQYRTIQ